MRVVGSHGGFNPNIPLHLADFGPPIPFSHQLPQIGFRDVAVHLALRGWCFDAGQARKKECGPQILKRNTWNVGKLSLQFFLLKQFNHLFFQPFVFAGV